LPLTWATDSWHGSLGMMNGLFAWKEPIKICKTGRYWYSCGLSSIDVSFISLKKVIPVVINLLKDDGELLCLIKPQFEAGREKVGKHGLSGTKRSMRK